MRTALQRIRENLDSFPRAPGVYVMKDAGGRQLYIGKAVDLRSRIKTYLDMQDDRRQVPMLLKKVSHIDWIATSNESEALILEANLVRTHKPRYNLDLKDDKHYPYLKVTLNEAFPRLVVVRRVQKDGGRYFGPYTDATTMRKVMSFAKKAFRLCDCKRILRPRPNMRPCLNYAIGRCSGACAGKITREAYRENIELLLKFLAGHRTGVISELRRRMEEASARLEFERAASLRDQIEIIGTASRLQKVDLRERDINRDVFGIYDDGRHMCLCVLCFREGLLLSKRHFVFNRRNWEYSRESRDALVLQFYHASIHEPPNEVLLPGDTGFTAELLEQWFVSETGRPIRVIVPQRGQKLDMIEMASRNARLFLVQKAAPDSRADLRELEQALCLPRYPRIIEAFDVSNLGESFAVAGMVQFKDGQPEKSGYRRFKIRSVEGQDDFAMLLEAVARRLARLRSEDRPFPDLVLIDGGRGQLNTAVKALADIENPPMIVSLAKKEEILYSPFKSSEIRLPETHRGRRLVERIRDEAHRFAVNYHRALRDRQFSRSLLENIEGVGPKRAQMLLRRFGSAARLRDASLDEIAAVRGISRAAARHLKAQLSR